jgi:uncharacterized protein (TIGR02598 family)
MKHHPSHRPNSEGFSLIEVTIAIGLVAFVLVALIGLLSLGIKTRGEGVRKTAQANIIQYLQDQLPLRAWNTNATATFGFRALTNFAGAAATNPVLFFDVNGSPVAATSTNDQFFQATIFVDSETTTNLAWPMSPPLGSVARALQVRSVIEWPVAAPTNTRDRLTVRTGLPSYE